MDERDPEGKLVSGAEESLGDVVSGGTVASSRTIIKLRTEVNQASNNTQGRLMKVL